MSRAIPLFEDGSLRCFLAQAPIETTVVLEGLAHPSHNGWMSQRTTDAGLAQIHFASCGGCIQIQVQLTDNELAARYNGYWLGLYDTVGQAIVEARFIDGLAVLSIAPGRLPYSSGRLDVLQFSTAEYALIKVDVERRRADGTLLPGESPEQVAARVLPPATQALRPRYLPESVSAGRVASEPLFTDTFP